MYRFSSNAKEPADRLFFVGMGIMLKETLKNLVRETVETLGYNLVESSYEGYKGQHQLRVIIHKNDNISTEDCSKVAGVLSRRLDVDDIIPDAYQLIVESPGVEYVFKEKSHFDLFKDKEIVLHIKNPSEYGYKDNVQEGLNLGLDQDNVLFRDAKGKECSIKYSDISKARLYFNIKKYL